MFRLVFEVLLITAILLALCSRQEAYWEGLEKGQRIGYKKGLYENVIRKSSKD